jgi:sec-independent protein translocase protein TatC
MPEERFSSGAGSMFEGFWGHVTEFIKRMKVVLATFLVSILVLLILPGNSDFFATTNDYKPLMSVLIGYINNMFLPPDAKLFASSMSDPITLYVYAALIFAIAITLPIFAYEAYKFVDPALYPHEKKAIFPFISITTILFIAGAIFGFFFLAPSFIQGFFPFYKAIDVQLLIPVMDFYNTVFFTIIISGVLFTIPAFFVLLVKFGVLHTKTFTKQRKYIYAGLGFLAMLISPGATPQGDLYLFLALVVLIEVSLQIGKRYEKKTGTIDAQSMLSQFLSPSAPPPVTPLAVNPTCRYCNSIVNERASYCPSCKKFLI